MKKSVEQVKKEMRIQLAKNQKIIRIKAYIESVKSLLEKAKEKQTDSCVIMLERSHFPLSYSSEISNYFVDQNLKPQLFDSERAKRVSVTFGTKDEKAVVATEVGYYEARLGDAKALLVTYTKKENPESVTSLKKKIKSLKLQYAALESRERKGKTGLNLQRGILITQKLLRSLMEEIKPKVKRNVGNYKTSKVLKDGDLMDLIMNNAVQIDGLTAVQSGSFQALKMLRGVKFHAFEGSLIALARSGEQAKEVKERALGVNPECSVYHITRLAEISIRRLYQTKTK